MRTNIGNYFIIITLITATSFAHNNNPIEVIIIDYPHGKTFLYVFRGGEGFLSYGSSFESRQIIKPNTYDIEKLYQQITPWLSENKPREQWHNPKSTAGMVTIFYQDKTKKDYLIFDAKKLTEKLFTKAKNNLTIGK